MAQVEVLPTDAGPAAGIELTAEQRRGMRMGILQSCLGALGYMAFTNGTILTYLTAQQVPSHRIVFYLSIGSIVMATLILPLAFLGDRHGKRRVGALGGGFELTGFSLLTISTLDLAGPMLREALTATGIALHAVGATAYVSTWFALLSPIVPEPMRGRFFGWMRTIWQVCAIGFAVICAAALSAESPLWVFRAVLATITIALAIRIVYYLGIPEMEPPGAQRLRFGQVLMSLVRTEAFMSFAAYGFLLYLFTGGVPVLFGLIEKRVLHYGDNMIVWLGIAYMVGCVIGFFFGGKMVDRWGTKPVFLLCHFGFSALLLLFLARGVHPAATLPIVAAVNLLFGVTWAASTIALSTETLALIPVDHKSMSTSFVSAMLRAGAALSGVLVAAALHLDLLAETWTLLRQDLSRYDAILLGFAVMILTMVVTLGLVPSVVRKAEWLPRQTG